VTVLEIVLHDEKSINVAEITPGEDGSGSWLGQRRNISFQKAG